MTAKKNSWFRGFQIRSFLPRAAPARPERMSAEELGMVLGSWTESSIHYRAISQLIADDEEEGLQGALDELKVSTATMNTHRIVGYLSTVGAMRELRRKVDELRAANRDDLEN